MPEPLFEDSVAEIYDVRELFEPYAAAQAARFITDLELCDLEAILGEWQALRDNILQRKRGATAVDMKQWLALNQKFRERLIVASRNELLLKIVQDLQVLTNCFSAQQGRPEILSEPLMKFTMLSYRDVLDAFVKRDSETAEEIVRQQIRYAKENILPLFE